MFGIMLILAYGPLDWAFPWWLWLFACASLTARATYQVKYRKWNNDD